MQSNYAMARARIELATVLFDASVDPPRPGRLGSQAYEGADRGSAGFSFPLGPK